jgi:hypothetical protein
MMMQYAIVLAFLLIHSCNCALNSAKFSIMDNPEEYSFVSNQLRLLASLKDIRLSPNPVSSNGAPVVKAINMIREGENIPESDLKSIVANICLPYPCSDDIAITTFFSLCSSLIAENWFTRMSLADFYSKSQPSEIENVPGPSHLFLVTSSDDLTPRKIKMIVIFNRKIYYLIAILHKTDTKYERYGVIYFCKGHECSANSTKWTTGSAAYYLEDFLMRSTYPPIMLVYRDTAANGCLVQQMNQ